MLLDPIFVTVISVLAYVLIIFFAFFGLFGVYIFIRYGRRPLLTVGGSVLYLIFFLGVVSSILQLLGKLS